MSHLKKALLASILFVSVAQFAKAEGINFQDLSLEEGIEKAKKENKKVFIDIYAIWCGPCKYLAKNIFVDDDLGAFMNEHFVSLKLDGEEGDGLQLMADFDLDSYPTLLYLDTDKTLLEKVVGALGAEELNSIANDVVFPELTEVYQLEKKYGEGNRDRDFLKEYIVATLYDDGDYEPLVKEFLDLYPSIDLDDEEEFLVFCLGISDRSHPKMEEFFEGIEHYSELHEGLVMTKLRMTIFEIVGEAVEKEDKDYIRTELDLIYDYYAQAEVPADLIEKEELVRLLGEAYDEGIIDVD